MQRREAPPPRELSHTRTGTLIIALLVGVVGILLAVALLGFELQSAVRAYVNGESLWTKAQKEATLHLLRYARDGDPVQLDRFHTALRVNHGDRLARLQLDREQPDWDAVRQGFLAGGNHPDDVDRLASAYRRLRSVWFVDSAIAIWAEADTWIDSLEAAGRDLAAIRPAVEPRADTTLALIARITAIDRRLTGYEQEFSGVLGEGARWTQRLLTFLVLGIGALLIVVAAIVVWTAMRRIRAEEVARRASEAALEAQLRRTQKMEAVGQLTGGIAHDFNNLLTIITANAEMLSGHPALEDASTQRILDEVRTAARRGAGLVRRLLALGKRDVLRIEPTDLRALVQEAVPPLRRGLTEATTLTTELDDGLPWVLADGDALQQVLLNLVSNAQDALPDGGTIRIVARQRDADVVTLEVHDNGVGMSAETRARAFEPFFSTKPMGTGNGLGLAMVEALMRQLGGSVGLESTPDRGTMVTIALRVAAPEQPGASATDASAPLGNDELVLLVEDEDALRLAARRVLVGAGYRVREAANGREAMDRLRESPEEVDLVLSDLVMPQMGGHELLAAAREAGYQHRFLFMSGYSPGLPREDEEPVPLLAKPWTVTELLTAVHHQLHGDG